MRIKVKFRGRFQNIDTKLEGYVEDNEIIILFEEPANADGYFRLLAATIRKETDLDHWGVWPARCKICGKEMSIVATRHRIENGYAEMMPDEALCEEHRPKG